MKAKIVKCCVPGMTQGTEVLLCSNTDTLNPSYERYGGKEKGCGLGNIK